MFKYRNMARLRFIVLSYCPDTILSYSFSDCHLFASIKIFNPLKKDVAKRYSIFSVSNVSRHYICTTVFLQQKNTTRALFTIAKIPF